MTTPYAGIPTHHATIDLPDDDDEVTGALFATPFAALKDEIELLRTLVFARPLADGVVPLCVAGSPSIEDQATPGWHYVTGVSTAAWVQGSVTSNLKLFVELGVLPGTLITTVTLNVAGGFNGAIHHTVLPVAMPSVRLISVDAAGAFTVDVGTLADPSPNIAAYDAAHTIVLAAGITTVAGRRYLLEITGESGSGAEPAHFGVYSVTLA